MKPIEKLVIIGYKEEERFYDFHLSKQDMKYVADKINELVETINTLIQQNNENGKR